MNLGVSIILCTLNRANALEATLTSLASVTLPIGVPVELVIVDNGSTDETKAVIEAFVAKTHWNVKLLVERRKGKSRALNLALRHASGDIFLFTDDDIRFPPDWIAGMCAPILNSEADFVQGGIRWAPHLKPKIRGQYYLPQMITSTAHKTEDEMRVALIGANMAFSRATVDVFKSFDEELGPGAIGLGEETLAGYQLLEHGMRRKFLPAVEVEHHFDGSRLDYTGILGLAAKRGRSAAYIQYHWEQRFERFPGFKRRFVRLKDFLRSLTMPAAGNQEAEVPDWKFGYAIQINRFDQLIIESKRERNYILKDGRHIRRSRKGDTEKQAR